MLEVKDMKKAVVHVRMEPNLKEDAEKVLDRLGISTSTAVTLFLKEVVAYRGIPFEVRIPDGVDLDEKSLNEEVEKGRKEHCEGKTQSLDDFDKEFKKKNNIK